jgi:hypothetical protein
MCDLSIIHTSPQFERRKAFTNVVWTCRDKPSGVEGFPLRKWNIQIFLINDHGEDVPATLFDKVVYKLHPSFDNRAVQSESLLCMLHLAQTGEAICVPLATGLMACSLQEATV